MSIRIMQGDCLVRLKELDACSVDAIVTDPPYGLSFMGKRWDYDVPSVEVWAECLRVLKPGGHLLAFAGTRTQHRMAVRIEDAGFEIRDLIAWVYWSGFPKSLDVSKAIDKAEGAEGEFKGAKTAAHAARKSLNVPEGWDRPWMADPEAMSRANSAYYPATDAARQWQGWGTALKPALEPITVARKPLAGTVAENVLKHGTGALNIDGCRVGDTVETWPASRSYAPGQLQPGHIGKTQSTGETPPGRWPANLIHDGSDEVLAGFPEDRPGMSGGGSGRRDSSMFGVGGVSKPEHFRGDSGSAARFFYCAKADKDDRNDGVYGLEPLFSPTMGNGIGGKEHDPKTATKKHNHHPTVKPTDLMRYLCRLVTPPGGLVLDPFMGSGSTLKAAELEGFSAIGIELDPAYVEIARRRIGSDAPLFADVEVGA